ncbi:hypothetical protein [Spirosoma utsteinense]|uniref:Pyruvoyl-dependent arginine decarboxylase (PvlArgDC) n=1 Tax=Spirosoma utsteinense TaxID=2585773 RepID=A0ABR6W3U5_9BACT|nr:hypothetical protein [Spirosoma utsteinense]MBC3785218.1 pyruvoyl-dependent arginine decarboxylase (PvlArgDC) [Spirosoma utsteinense]MBC3790557.1 pyruvoyl-dependent arginine decarboxylase (PvlArgDC) [Spirosoma utsteinense]
MANKTIKTKQKSLASDIVSSIEAKLGEAGDASKKIKKSIEKSAGKLAKKLVKLMDKTEKKQTKPAKSVDKKAKKNAAKAQKNALKAEKNAKRATNTKAQEVAKAALIIADTSKPVPRPTPNRNTRTVPVSTRKTRSTTANPTAEPVESTTDID